MLNPLTKLFISLGTINAVIVVALGAFGAHALKSRIPVDLMAVYQTGIQYHFYHALGLIVIGIVAFHLPQSIWLRWAGWIMLAGIILFSGSLYLLALTNIKWLGAITPLGGTAFIVSWLLLTTTLYSEFQNTNEATQTIRKIAINNEKAPDLNKVFNWGLKVSNFDELFLISGHGAMNANFQAEHPGDPAAQARHIFLEVQEYMHQNGYSFDDLIQIKMTITKEVTEAQFNEIVDVYSEFMHDVKVLPTGGTMRVVDRLAFPGMMVEFEFMAAK